MVNGGTTRGPRSTPRPWDAVRRWEPPHGAPASASGPGERWQRRRGVDVFYWLVKAILVPILRPLFRPWVEGMENVPRHGPAIRASNHLSFCDSVFLPLMVPRKILFLAKSDYFTG